eukprot:NODE_30_length_32972_cov_0.541052.p11 type:complete len:320 gc:universal NODE_30_length_32972_cov_0.541052:24681-25640(+)
MANLAPCPYKLGKELGEGSYAIVKETCHMPTGKKYAAKIFNKKLIKNKQHVVLNEINILKELSDCPDCILKLVDYFESLNNLYVIMELASEDLFDKMLRGVTETDTIITIKRVLSALEFLHSHNITHRDLKPENILLRQYDNVNTAMVGDFGLAKLISVDGNMRTLCGTPGYMSPEVLNKAEYTNAVDVWSVGCIAFFMLTGSPPFEKPSTLEELKAILNVDVNIPQNLTVESQDFIKNCLKRDPRHRFTVLQCQAHYWINGKSANMQIITGQSRMRWKKAIDAVQFIRFINKKAEGNKILLDVPAPVKEELIEMVVNE